MNLVLLFCLFPEPRGGVKCLFKRWQRKHSFTSALFLSWIFICTWRPTWMCWKATVASTDGPSLWRITVRLLSLIENPTKTLNLWCIFQIITPFWPPSSPGASQPGVSAAKRPCGTAAGVLAIQRPQILSTYDVHDPLLLRGSGEDGQSGTSSNALYMTTSTLLPVKMRQYVCVTPAGQGELHAGVPGAWWGGGGAGCHQVCFEWEYRPLEQLVSAWASRGAAKCRWAQTRRWPGLW